MRPHINTAILRDWHEGSPEAQVVASMIKSIHAFLENPECSPLYKGIDCGMNISGRNNPVIFQEHVLHPLRCVSRGAWEMPVDSHKRVHDGPVVCQPFPDELTCYHRKLILELIPLDVALSHNFVNDSFVEVPIITGSFANIESTEVSVSEFLRMLVRNSLQSCASKFSAQEALQRIRIGETEAYMTAAQRLVLYCRAWIAEHDRPHISEAFYFWRFVTEDQLQDLLGRFLRMVCPNYSKEELLKFSLLRAQVQVSNELQPFRIENAMPLSDHMVNRGNAARSLFNDFVVLLDRDRRLTYLRSPQRTSAVDVAVVGDSKRSYDLRRRSEDYDSPIRREPPARLNPYSTHLSASDFHVPSEPPRGHPESSRTYSGAQFITGDVATSDGVGNHSLQRLGED